MNKLVQSIFLALIAFYQKYLSPIKGYKCAYGRYYHTHTCSSYGKKVILRFGPWIGLRLLSRQFDACAWTNRTYFKPYLHLASTNAKPPLNHQHYQKGSVDCDCGAPDCGSCDSNCNACDLNPFGENKFFGDNCSLLDSFESSNAKADRHEARKNGKRTSSKSSNKALDSLEALDSESSE